MNNSYNNTTCRSPSETQHYIIAKRDSRASCHFFCPDNATVLDNITNHSGLTVQQPDNTALLLQGTGNFLLLKKTIGKGSTRNDFKQFEKLLTNIHGAIV